MGSESWVNPDIAFSNQLLPSRLLLQPLTSSLKSIRTLLKAVDKIFILHALNQENN